MRKYLFLFLLIALSACGGSSLPLVADFSIEQTDALSVILDASASSPSQDIVSYTWKLGNGETASGKTLSYRYTEAGNYLVELTLTNKANESKAISKQVSLIATTEATALTQSAPESAFIIDNTSKQSLSWQLKWSHSSDNPQTGDWFMASPSSGKLAAQQKQEVVLSLKSNLKAGTYKANMLLEYSGGMQRFSVTALVGQATGFGLITKPDYSQEPPLTLEAGAGGIVQLNITRSPGFTDAVSLSLIGAPQGITASFSPQNTSGNSATLELELANTVINGDYRLTLKGETAKGQTASTSLLLRIIKGQVSTKGFGLSLSPSQLELNPGESAKLNLQVNRNDFSLPVTITDNGLPQGASLSYSANPVMDLSELSLNLDASTKPGNYYVNLWGQADSTSNSVTLNLVVKAADVGDGNIVGSVTTDNSLLSLKALRTASSEPFDRAIVRHTPVAEYVPGQLIVKYKSAALSSLDSLSADSSRPEQLTQTLALSHRMGLQHLQSLGTMELLSVDLDPLSAARQLASDPRVDYAEPNYYLYTQGLPNDPRVNEQWHLASAGLPVAWEIESGSSRSVVVAIIDSGFDLDHPDLANQFIKGYDFCGQSNCALGIGDNDPGNGDSANGHGTHVAGIIGAAGNNNLGVAGVAYGNKVKLLPVKIFNDFGEGATVSNFINGIRWSVGLSVEGVASNTNPARVINMSLGAYFDSKSIQAVINEAREAGALLIAATGNDGIGRVMSPAAANNVLGVGSINPSYKRSCFSNFGSDISLGSGKVDLVAAGGDGAGCANIGILSTLPDGQYGLLAGTSMAAPMVAGIAALVLSQNPEMNVAALEQTLLANSFFDPGYMNSNEYGAGVLRADLALGQPGPGTQVSISASGNLDSAIDNVTLDLFGTSTSFSLSGLLPDRYIVEAVAAGSKFQLKAANGVNLTAGETESRVLNLK